MDFRRSQDIKQVRQYALLVTKELELMRRRMSKMSAQIADLTGEKQDLQKELDLVAKQANESAAKETGVTAKQRRNRSRRRKRDKKRKKKRKPRSTSGPTPQPELDRVDQTCLFENEIEQYCPHCADSLMRPRPGDFEESELIDLVEVRYVVRKVKRQKYICPCCTYVAAAPGPQRGRKGGRYSLLLVMAVAVAKYVDHLPLERQTRRMRRSGLKVSSQTLFDQLAAISQELLPTYRALFWWVLSQEVVGVDQTGWPRLNDQVRDWQLWNVSVPGKASFYAARLRKDTETALHMLSNYSGTVVCDEMKSHAAAARAGPGKIDLSRCWSHGRAKFFDAENDFPEAGPILDDIAELYQIEARGLAEGKKALAKLRRELSAPVTCAIHEKLLAIEQSRHPEGVSIRVAARYSLRNWKELTRFLSDPSIPLDNNFTERALRQPVVGRKNHYGSRTQRGADTSMVLYTLLETARLCGVDPATYLHEAVVNARQGLNFGVTLPFEHPSLKAAPKRLPWEDGAEAPHPPPQKTLPL